MKNISQLIDGFFGNNLSDAEYKMLYAHLKSKEADKIEESEPEEPLKTPHATGWSVYDNHYRTLLSNGYAVNIFKCGKTQVEHAGREVEIDDSYDFRISIHILKHLWQRIAKDNKTERETLQSEIDNQKQKTRYIGTTNKKMFVSGMIIGRNNQ
jgi:hypothetical protein